MVIAGLEEPNRLEIKAEMESYYMTEVNHGRLYPNLDTLVDRGLHTKSKKDEQTNAYELTDEGKMKPEDRWDWEARYFDFD